MSYKKPTLAENKEHYSKADDKWLQLKIEREIESIKQNEQHIVDAKDDISICMDILIDRGVGLK